MAGIFQRVAQRLGLSAEIKPDITKQDVAGEARTADYKGIYNHFWGRYPRDLPPFTFLTVQTMLFDPTIKLGLAMRAAPLYGLQWAYREPGQEEWKSGIKATSVEVGQFVLRQLERIWSTDLDGVLTAQIWGWSAGEVTLCAKDGKVEIDCLLPRHANDVRARKYNGDLCGVRVLRCPNAKNGYVDLNWPKAWWHAFNPEAGNWYGQSVLLGCYSPWFDKWMDGGGLDVRRLFMHKDAYAGADLTYPEGMLNIPGKGEVPTRDIARELVEQIVAGGVTTRPCVFDQNGNELWKLTRATVASNPGHILQYPKDLDVEILRGMECPDDVLTSGGTGAWAGKRVPMSAFYSGLDRWASRVIRDLDNYVIRPIVRFNFGDEADYQITYKPLAEQAMEQQGETQQKQPGAAGGGNPFDALVGGRQQPGQNGDSQRPQPQRIPPHPGGNGQPGQRMSLDAVEAVGDGVLSAGELVEAAKRVLRMRVANWKEDEHPRDDSGQFAEKEGGETESVSKSNKSTKSAKTKDEREAEKQAKFESLLQSKSASDQDAFRRAKADGIAIPPAWTDVTYYGKDANIRAEGRDAQGRKQRAENPEYRQRISDENNARISRELWPRIGKLRDQLRAAAEAGDEEAKVLYLITQTGFRIGGKGDGKAKMQAYGASTLRGEHVRVDGDTVTFDFPGKKGVAQRHTVTDPVIASMVRHATPGEPIFATRDVKVRDAWQTRYGGYKVHDIRHVVAREEAERRLAELIPPPPTSKKEQAAIIKDVATVASQRLGNNPSEALATYIDPRVFDSVKVAV